MSVGGVLAEMDETALPRIDLLWVVNRPMLCRKQVPMKNRMICSHPSTGLVRPPGATSAAVERDAISAATLVPVIGPARYREMVAHRGKGDAMSVATKGAKTMAERNLTP